VCVDRILGRHLVFMFDAGREGLDYNYWLLRPSEKVLTGIYVER
jgi:hypothetical protein